MTTDLLSRVQQAIKKSKADHPNWPEHVVAQAAMVQSQTAVLTGLAIAQKYGKADNKQAMEQACIDNIAANLRFLENL